MIVLSCLLYFIRGQDYNWRASDRCCCVVYCISQPGKVTIGQPEIDASAELLSVFQNLATLQLESNW